MRNEAEKAGQPVLSLQRIHKTFGGLVAVEDVGLDLYAGEIVALVGDNGAGKSTLLKIISGVHKPTSGKIYLDGKEIGLQDAATARLQGIEVVYQDLALADQQPVYMNMFLGRELLRSPLGLLDRRKMNEETRLLVEELDLRIPSTKSKVRDLSGGQRQGIAIARATRWARKLVLLDEPTAALGVAETKRVESIIKSLKERALAILLISHSLDQVFRLSDRICVLRRGAQIGIRDTRETDKNEIVSMITGLG
ncbi:MAG: ATP-binding cassette domain-containing protein [Albidovulum sp.]|nr:ATP-binding cassette domain-containing protein [Albidovulum sp.]MDE0532032.1 ATP-binding cassette domain-containing protein [Albidovulum sp.]